MGKMYRVRIDVEPKCAAEDSENRVYLSLVPVEEKPAQKRIPKKAYKKMKDPVWNAVKLLISFPLALGAGIWLMRLAYQQRGYDAIGGEYFLIIAAAWGIYWLVNKIMEAFK